METYRLLNIVLLESEFKRGKKSLNEKDLNFAINIEKDLKEKNLYIALIVTLRDISENEGLFIKIKMLGVFEMVNSNALSVEDFSRINAPAIIFPFVREHVSSLTLKAGLEPIFLPPINFVELSKNNK